MTIKISREFWIGALVLLCIGILFFGVNFLKGVNIFSPSNYYYAKFANVNGLTESAEVSIKGKKVGLVTEINYNYDDPTQDIIVVLQVYNDMKLPIGSKAVLESGLLGGASIKLDPGMNPDMSMLYTPGDTIPTFIAGDLMTAVSNQIMPKVEKLVPQLDSLLDAMNTLVGNKDIAASLQHINKMTGNFEVVSAQLKTMVNDIPPILKDAKHITGNFSNVSDNLNGIDFAATMKKVDNSMADLNKLTTKLNSGEGTLGLLLNDKSLYNNLNTTVNSANELVVDLKANPKRYVNITVFGKKDKE